MRTTRQLLIIASIFLLTLQGCASISYYTGSLGGQLRLDAAKQPVDRIVADPANSEALRRELSAARDIRQFAVDHLALPDNDSYRNYVDTGSDFVSWAVFAAPEFSLNVRTWCFPIFGCVPYRGYFSPDDALKFGRSLKAQGLDVYVGGIPAYSTLGWFSDPLLNTMLGRGEAYLAEVVFHELSHQRVYVRNDTEFNEAFAVAVEQAGTRDWLLQKNDPVTLRHNETARMRQQDFVDLIAAARDELNRIYQSNRNAEERRAAKSAAIDNLRKRYQQVKRQRWNGFSGYDPWFSAPINNAKLATVSVYNDLTPAFSRLLDLCAGEYERFYQAVERLGKLDRDKRRKALIAVESCA